VFCRFTNKEIFSYTLIDRPFLNVLSDVIIASLYIYIYITYINVCAYSYLFLRRRVCIIYILCLSSNTVDPSQKFNATLYITRPIVTEYKVSVFSYLCLSIPSFLSVTTVVIGYNVIKGAEYFVLL
jgi:hypothetical protein